MKCIAIQAKLVEEFRLQLKQMTDIIVNIFVGFETLKIRKTKI